MRFLLLVLCLLPATGCLGSSPSAPSPIDREVVLAPGQTAQLAANVSVRFITVVGDSRCPGDALCIQGGDAIVRVEISSGRARAERELHTGSLQPVQVDDLVVRLMDLAPYPFSSLPPTQPADYRATLRVTR